LLAQQSREIGQAPAEASPKLQILEQEQSDQRGPDLNLRGLGAGADESFGAQVLLQPLQQLNDILPINNALLMSRSTIASIPCVPVACR